MYSTNELLIYYLFFVTRVWIIHWSKKEVFSLAEKRYGHLPRQFLVT